jgi:hypothetical protein
MTRHGNPKGYWELRKDRDMYKLMVSMARHYAPDAKSAIDIGCYVGGFICELDWIKSRTACDINNWSKEWADVEGVEFRQADFFSLEIDEPIDLVISNQTIEHVDDAGKFAHRLCEIGKVCLVSTTYLVPQGVIEGHIQDPIDFDKFVGWFPRPPRAVSVFYEKPFNNIVGVF